MPRRSTSRKMFRRSTASMAKRRPRLPESEPLISVVITCFNYAKYVAGAIECVLRQGYPHKELVVVNDGSTDASLSIIQRYAERLTLVDQPNQGSIAAY